MVLPTSTRKKESSQKGYVSNMYPCGQNKGQLAAVRPSSADSNRMPMGGITYHVEEVAARGAWTLTLFATVHRLTCC